MPIETNPCPEADFTTIDTSINIFLSTSAGLYYTYNALHHNGNYHLSEQIARYRKESYEKTNQQGRIMPSYLRQVRNISRFQRIATVFARHGFGNAIEYLNLDRILSLPRSLFRQPAPVPRSTAERFRSSLEELGPTFVKLGQVLSTRPDMLPPEFIQELNKLTDSVTPLPWETMRAVYMEDTGQDPQEIFSEIETEPLGSASLAQVHAARLPDGREVVLKIQRPDLEKIIKPDLEILEDISRLVQHTPLGEIYRPHEFVSEFALTLRTELDYYREGRNADRFRENFAGDSALYIPEIFWQYTTRRVLVMERISGLRLDDIAAIDAQNIDRHQIALNASRMILKEILEDGFFHADPHAGNLLVMTDGRIGAMDFGMVGQLSHTEKLNLAHLFNHAVQMDERGVVETLLRMGAARDHLNRQELEREVSRLLRDYSGVPLKEIRAQDLIDKILPITYKHKLFMPGSYYLLLKTLTMMEGLGARLDPEFDIFVVAKSFLGKLTAQIWHPSSWGPALLSSLSSWQNFISEVPRSGSDFLRDIREGRPPFSVELTGSKKTLDRLDRLITRLSMSVLIAGLVIGLGMLLPVAAENNYFLAVVVTGFMTLFAMGFWMLISILRN